MCGCISGGFIGTVVFLKTELNIVVLLLRWFYFPCFCFLRYILLLFVLFFIPGVVMIIAYGLISRELYRGIQFELEQRKGQCGET